MASGRRFRQPIAYRACWLQRRRVQSAVPAPRSAGSASFPAWLDPWDWARFFSPPSRTDLSGNIQLMGSMKSRKNSRADCLMQRGFGTVTRGIGSFKACHPDGRETMILVLQQFIVSAARQQTERVSRGEVPKTVDWAGRLEGRRWAIRGAEFGFEADVDRSDPDVNQRYSRLDGN